MAKVRVPLYKTPGKAVTIETEPGAAGSGLARKFSALQSEVARLRAAVRRGGSGGALASTDDLREGSRHLYFKARRAVAAVVAKFTNNADIHLAEDETGISATLQDTAVAAGDYGDASHIPTFTVDSKGRLTAAGEAAFSALPDGGTTGQVLTKASGNDGDADWEDGGAQGIALSGRVATYGDLPTSGLAAGDAYLVDADGLIYVYNGAEFPADGAGLDVSGGGGSPLTTKGDLYAYDTDNTRLPVGTDGQVLKADSGADTGLRWEDQSAGGPTVLDMPDGITLSGDTISGATTENTVRLIAPGTIKYIPGVAIPDVTLDAVGGTPPYTFSRDGRLFKVTDSASNTDERPVRFEIVQRYRDVVLARDPVAYYPLDETSGVTAHDISGNGYDGTWNGSPDLSGDGLVSTDTDHAALLDGNGQFAEMTQTALMTFIVQRLWTVEAWIKCADYDNDLEKVLGIMNGPTNYAGAINGDQYTLSYNGFTMTLPSAFENDSTYHLVMTLNDSACEFFVNGASVGSGTSNGKPTAATSVQIGAQHPKSQDYFNGRVAHWALYAGVLSADAIAAHYNAGKVV